jgi:hypothetical protein
MTKTRDKLLITHKFETCVKGLTRKVGNRIQSHVQQLIGLQLTIARLAGSGRNFHFGPIRPVDKGTVGEFALHIQCAWRLEGPDGIYTGDRDIWWPNPETERWSKDWSYEKGNSVQDTRLKELLQGYDPETRSWINTTDQLFVERVKTSQYGDLTLYLSGEYRLVLFLTNTTKESWRLFRPRSKRPHLVIDLGRD